MLYLLIDSVIPLEEMTDVSTILGMLLSLRHLLSHLMSKWQSHDSGQQQMKGSFGAKFSESDAKLDVRQLVKVSDISRRERSGRSTGLYSLYGEPTRSLMSLFNFFSFIQLIS